MTAAPSLFGFLAVPCRAVLCCVVFCLPLSSFVPFWPRSKLNTIQCLLHTILHIPTKNPHWWHGSRTRHRCVAFVLVPLDDAIDLFPSTEHPQPYGQLFSTSVHLSILPNNVAALFFWNSNDQRAAGAPFATNKTHSPLDQNHYDREWRPIPQPSPFIFTVGSHIERERRQQETTFAASASVLLCKCTQRYQIRG